MDKYKAKQEWIEAVMADRSLSPATARYAFGIHKHMYGEKDTSFPGAKALAQSTGLSDSHFYEYNEALQEAGYLEVTSTRGRSNTYQLVLPTSDGGRYLPPQGVDPPRQGVGGTPTGGTNTTRKTPKKTTKKDNSNAPVVTDVPTVTSSKPKESGTKEVPSWRKKSKELLDSMKEEKNSEEQRGRQHLEYLLKKSLLLDSEKEQALSWFEDMKERPEVPKGIRRAALAHMNAQPKVEEAPAAPVEDEVW